jgi:hypothetical protein
VSQSTGGGDIAFHRRPELSSDDLRRFEMKPMRDG